MRWAALLIFAIVALKLLDAALLPTRRSYMFATMRQDITMQTPFGVDPELVITIASYVIAGWELFWALLWLLWGIKVRQGRNWARVLATIFAVVGMLDYCASLFRLTSDMHPAAYSYLFSLVVVLTEAAVVVLLFRPGSGQWFRARKAWKRRQRWALPT